MTRKSTMRWRLVFGLILLAGCSTTPNPTLHTTGTPTAVPYGQNLQLHLGSPTNADAGTWKVKIFTDPGEEEVNPDAGSLVLPNVGAGATPTAYGPIDTAGLSSGSYTLGIYRDLGTGEEGDDVDYITHNFEVQAAE